MPSGPFYKARPSCRLLGCPSAGQPLGCRDRAHSFLQQRTGSTVLALVGNHLFTVKTVDFLKPQARVKAHACLRRSLLPQPAAHICPVLKVGIAPLTPRPPRGSCVPGPGLGPHSSLPWQPAEPWDQAPFVGEFIMQDVLCEHASTQPLLRERKMGPE